MTPYYEEDGIQIFHANCCSVLPNLSPVDLVVTDPPYSLGRNRAEWRISEFIATGLSLAADKVRPGGAMLVMAAASGRNIEYVQGAIGATLPLNRLLVWHKRFVNSPVAGPWRWDIVPVLAFGRCSFGRPSWSSCYITDGQYRGDEGDHPSALPPSIGTWLVAPFVEATTVLDPFCGSGTILEAARLAGKQAIGIEIEERWCEAAAKRLAQGVLAL